MPPPDPSGALDYGSEVEGDAQSAASSVGKETQPPHAKQSNSSLCKCHSRQAPETGYTEARGIEITNDILRQMHPRSLMKSIEETLT
jgi:hypothetical protein